MTAPFYVPPEQLVKDRAEFARKGISRGRPIVVAQTAEGILLIGVNSSPSLRKIGEIYDRVAFAGVGRFNEFETLRVAGVRYADLKGYSYARQDVTAKGLANAYSQTLGQIFSHEVKPYEVDIVVAELGQTPTDDKIFRVHFDGTLRDADGLAVLGAEEESIARQLADSHDAAQPVASALNVICQAIEGASGESTDPDGWEAGFLDREATRRAFRRLTPHEIASARA